MTVKGLGLPQKRECGVNSWAAFQGNTARRDDASLMDRRQCELLQLHGLRFFRADPMSCPKVTD
jgi:hypothetical protein